MRSCAALVLLALLACAGPAVAQECVSVEDFSKGKIGEFPPDWKPRKESGRAVYSIREANGLRYLQALARGIGVQAGRPYEWDPKAYPILAWSWRPVEFPAGSDERKSKTNDSALAVYAVFPYSSVSVKALKYVWSAVVPVGTRLTSSAGMTQVRVIRNGTDRKAVWTEERVNVLEDYKKFFEETEVPRASGIAVLTDSDDTRSSAAGDYAHFRLCKL